MGSDSFHLERFVEAQASIYPRVIAELRSGEKRSHWMWFVFPQMKGLGFSSMAQKYGIGSQAEAEAYLQHEVLGPRLRECTQLVNAVEGRSVDDIFGCPDNLKFHSSMTLFAMVSEPGSIFHEALSKFFNGKMDPVTEERIG